MLSIRYCKACVIVAHVNIPEYWICEVLQTWSLLSGSSALTLNKITALRKYAYTGKDRGTSRTLMKC